jgi:hypothetical protein
MWLWGTFDPEAFGRKIVMGRSVGACSLRAAELLRPGRACRFALLAYLASVFGRPFVAKASSAHALALLGALGGVLGCISLLAWLVFRKSEPHAPCGL